MLCDVLCCCAAYSGIELSTVEFQTVPGTRQFQVVRNGGTRTFYGMIYKGETHGCLDLATKIGFSCYSVSEWASDLHVLTTGCSCPCTQLNRA